MKIFVIFLTFLFLSFSITIDAQQSRYLKKKVSSTITMLRGNGVKEIIAFSRYYQKGSTAVIIWKENSVVMGRELIYSDKKFIQRQLNDSTLQMIKAESTLQFRCDSKSLENYKKVIVSPNFLMNLRIINESEIKNFDFSYSQYLGLEDSACIEDIKPLLSFTLR